MSRGTATERVVPTPLVVSSRQRRLVAGDRVFEGLAVGAGIVILMIAAVFVLSLFFPALPAITRFGFGFLTSSTWDPVRLQFGALPAIYGTLLTSAIGLLLAFPIGIGAALFLAEDARLGLLRGPLSFAVELLAGIPSVVIGLWAFFILTPLMRDNVDPFLSHTLGFLPFFQGSASGYGFLTAGVVLAIMVLPILIALGRALGETIAVTMVIGNRPQITASLFAQGYTLPSVIANEFTEAVGNLYQGALFELGVILALIPFIVN